MTKQKKDRGTFGSNLRQIRRNLDITQEELSKKTGLSQAAIALMESGQQKNVTLKTIRVLAWALDVKISKLVD